MTSFRVPEFFTFLQPESPEISHVISYDFLCKLVTEDMECRKGQMPRSKLRGI